MTAELLDQRYCLSSMLVAQRMELQVAREDIVLKQGEGCLFCLARNFPCASPSAQKAPQLDHGQAANRGFSLLLDKGLEAV